MKKYFSKLKSFLEKFSIIQLNPAMHKIQEALGRIELRQLESIDNKDIADNEFRVFSQWGEDGIIQFLIRHIKIKNKVFVEFGVQNYTESNTRFLLVNNNWAGLVMDSSKKNIDYIRNDPIYWQHQLTAVPAFITRENINRLLSDNGIYGDIGLLSIDIDGNDYWVWEAIEVAKPVIVIVEYNHRFGCDRAVTIPYDENFMRAAAHYSNIYYGASLKALWLLGKKKGYAFVGCNRAGNNAFFVRKDSKPEEVRELTVEEGFVTGRFRESQDISGRLNYLTPEKEAKIFECLKLVEVD